MANSELPPAYNSLHTSTVNIAAAEATVPICEDDKFLVSVSFEDKTTRVAFIQKVLAIKLLQLLGVLLVMTFFVYNKNAVWRFMRWENDYVHIFILSTFAYLVIFGLLIYCDEARRTNPYRYMFLVAYPLSYTLLISFTIIWWETPEISAAFYYYCTAVIALLLYSIFANQANIEFVTKNGNLIISLVLIITFAITVPQLYAINVFHIIYTTIAAGVDLAFLLLSLEKMTSKNYRIIINPDDFVDAALSLHVDYYYIIINSVIPEVKNGFEKLSAQLIQEREERNESN